VEYGQYGQCNINFLLAHTSGYSLRLTQFVALHRKSYISFCSGSQETSSKASSETPISRKQYTMCLHDKYGLQQLSSHEQLFWHQSPASSYISTRYSSPVSPITVNTKPSSAQTTSVQNMSCSLALRIRSFCHDSILPKALELAQVMRV